MVAALNRFVQPYLKKLPRAFTRLLTTELLSQLVFSSEPWTSYLQTQVKSLCTKEQQRGENSSFIDVSKRQADPKTQSQLYDLPMSLRIYFILSHTRWTGKPCTSLVRDILWYPLMHALGKSPKKTHLPRWMPGWSSTLKQGYQTGESGQKSTRYLALYPLAGGSKEGWILSQLPSARGRRCQLITGLLDRIIPCFLDSSY